MQFGFSDVSFEKAVNNINENIKLKHSLDMPFSSDVQIVDIWCNPILLGVSTDKGGAEVNGNMQVCVIVRDKQGEPSYYERMFDFSEHFDTQLPERCEIKCCVSPVGCYAVINGESIEVATDVNVNMDIIEQTQCKVISSAEIMEEHKRKCQPSSVVVYFATEGESVWDIARRYHSSPEAILCINGMRTEVIDRNTTVVIPAE